MMNPQPCPKCQSLAAFSPKREKYYCAECEDTFEPLTQKIDPQTIFLSYAHKSEKAEDYDISEELVLLVKAALEQDGHTVWIDQEGIRGGHNWRENITRAILSHDHFLSFLSKRSVRNPGVCLNEIAIALDKGVNFQTVLTEPEDVVKPPITVTDTQWHQFVGWKEAHSEDKASWDVWFEERMKGIRAQIEDAKNARAPGELTILRRALDPKTFHQDIAKKTEGFFGRKWLFDAFDQWLDTTNDQIFWLKGSPGIGKSAFAAKLVHQSNSRIMGFFKCDFQALKSPEESAREVICTLAYQLATRMPDYRAKLLYGQGVNDPEVILKKTADDLFRFLITEPLNKQGKIVEGQRSAIVIDALDEAGRNDGTNPLLILIKKHAPNLPDWLGIVITSRPEGYIVQELVDIKAQSVSGDTQENTDDLKAYLDKQLDPKIVGYERHDIISQIIIKSDGAFLYISQIIKDKYDLTQPKLLPDGMNGYFMENFNRYFPDTKDYGKETEPFLELMVAAPGPLPKDLGKDLLGWTYREVTMQVTEPMGSLLQEKDGCLVFFHKSLVDWLRDSRRSGRYQVNPDGARKLGEFLWREYEYFCPRSDSETRVKQAVEEKSSLWEVQIFHWLTSLLPHIDQWRDISALRVFADYLNNNLFYKNELKLREQILHLSGVAFGEKSSEFAKCLGTLGDLSELLGQYHNAEIYFRRSINIFEEALGTQHQNVATALDDLGSLLSYLNQKNEAELVFKRALKIREDVLGAESVETAKSLNNLALLYKKQNRSAESESFFKKSLHILEISMGKESLLTVMSNHNYASLLDDMGRFKEAEILARSSLKYFDEKLGHFHPYTAGSLDNLGLLLKKMGCYDEAEDLLSRSLKIYQKIFDPEHPDTARALNNLGGLFESMGRNHEAEILYIQALEMRRVLFGPEHEEVGDSLNTIGYFLTDLARFDEAKIYLEKALGIHERWFDSFDPRLSYTLDSYGYLLYKMQLFNEAEPFLVRSFNIRKAAFGLNHVQTKKSKIRLNNLNKSWGKSRQIEIY